MKNHLLIVSLFTGLVFMTSSCKKEESEPTPTPPAPVVVTNAFYAQVDAVEFVEQSLSSSNSNGTILINASKSVGPTSIGLVLPSTVVAGSYQSSAFGSYRIQYTNGSTSNDIYVVDGGSIQISQNDQTNRVIRGSFSGTAIPIFGSTSTNQYVITDGTFTMNY